MTELMHHVEKENRPEIGPNEFGALSTTSVYDAMITESYTEDRRNRSRQPQEDWEKAEENDRWGMRLGPLLLEAMPIEIIHTIQEARRPSTEWRAFMS